MRMNIPVELGLQRHAEFDGVRQAVGVDIEQAVDQPVGQHAPADTGARLNQLLHRPPYLLRAGLRMCQLVHKEIDDAVLDH